MNRYRYRRTKESKRREMEKILQRLEEKQKIPECANDEELEQLIKLCKIHLGVKDEGTRQTDSGTK